MLSGVNKWGRINGVGAKISFCLFLLRPHLFPFIHIPPFIRNFVLLGLLAVMP